MAGKGFKIDGYEGARRIVQRGFDPKEAYLRGLVSKVTRDGRFADSLNYRGLVREYWRIRAVAEKMLKSKAQQRTGSKILDTIAEEWGELRGVQGELF